VIYKHRRLEKKLREYGRHAQATILSIRTEIRGSRGQWRPRDDNDLPEIWKDCLLRLQVMPTGEPPFEATIRAHMKQSKAQGEMVQVLYDPDDRDHVVLDSDADARQADEYRRMIKEDSATGDELMALFDTGERARAGDSQARLDYLQQLADLHEHGVLSDDEFAAEKAHFLNQS
jgi:hypothetical protein